MKLLSEIQKRERELRQELESIKREKQKIADAERTALIKKWDLEAREKFGMNARQLLGISKSGADPARKTSSVGKYYFDGEVIDGRAARHRADFPALENNRIDDARAAENGYLNPGWVDTQPPAILKKLGLDGIPYSTHDRRAS